MSDTSGPGVSKIYEEAESKIPSPNRSEYGKYIMDMMNMCLELGASYGRTGGALGNMKGHWFEMLCKAIFEKDLGKGSITVHANDKRSHKISEIKGFENVTWITYPDAIIINEQNLKAAISIKWGMRHDRMYEILYAALAMKDHLREQGKPLNFYLLTNDDSPARMRAMLEAPMLDGVYHINPKSIHPSSGTQGNVLRRLKGLDDLLGQLRLFVD